MQHTASTAVSTRMQWWSNGGYTWYTDGTEIVGLSWDSVGANTDKLSSLRYATPTGLCHALDGNLGYKSLIDSIFFITPTMPTDAEVPSDILTHSSDDWEHDPANPRQWSQAKKWQAMTIVRNSIRILSYGVVSLGFTLYFHCNTGKLHDGTSCAWNCGALWYGA